MSVLNYPFLLLGTICKWMLNKMYSCYYLVVDRLYMLLAAAEICLQRGHWESCCISDNLVHIQTWNYIEMGRLLGPKYASRLSLFCLLICQTFERIQCNKCQVTGLCWTDASGMYSWMLRQARLPQNIYQEKTYKIIDILSFCVLYTSSNSQEAAECISPEKAS